MESYIQAYKGRRGERDKGRLIDWEKVKDPHIVIITYYS